VAQSDPNSTSGPDVSALLEPPRAVIQASVDDKGRLKLPSEFQAHLEALGVTRVFITTLDRRMARIYAPAVWKVNEELFRNAGTNAGPAARVAFRARVYGGESDIDKSGRVLVPAKLREELNLEKQPVWLEAHNDGINVMNKAVFEARLQESDANAASDVDVLSSVGLK
jgi:MraZ protein